MPDNSYSKVISTKAFMTLLNRSQDMLRVLKVFNTYLLRLMNSAHVAGALKLFIELIKKEQYKLF